MRFRLATKKRWVKSAFWSLIFVSLVGLQIGMIYGVQTTETVGLESTFISHPEEVIRKEPFELNIFSPKTHPGSQEKYPTCILLHGDGVRSKAFNFLKRELLKNGFIVVSPDIEVYTSDTYFTLNATLNYLVQRSDVASNQIVIAGHSRGSHFAYNFAAMRTDFIKAAICGNFGTLENIYLDFYIFYFKYIDWNHPSSIVNFIYRNPFSPMIDEMLNVSLAAQKGIPNNLMLVTDAMDRNPDVAINYYLSNLTDGGSYQPGIQYGNFSDGSAKKTLETRSPFGHFSSIFHPKAVQKEIEWIRSTLDLSFTPSQYGTLFLQISFFLFNAVLIGVTGVGSSKFLIGGALSVGQSMHPDRKRKIRKVGKIVYGVFEVGLFIYLIATSIPNPIYLMLFMVYGFLRIGSISA